MFYDDGKLSHVRLRYVCELIGGKMNIVMFGRNPFMICMRDDNALLIKCGFVVKFYYIRIHIIMDGVVVVVFYDLD